MGDINLREICKTFPIKTNEGKRKAKGNGLGENKENHENEKGKKEKLAAAFKIFEEYNVINNMCMEEHNRSFTEMISETSNIPLEMSMTPEEKIKNKRASKQKLKTEIEMTKKNHQWKEHMVIVFPWHSDKRCA